jgi:hypothetical protein
MLTKIKLFQVQRTQYYLPSLKWNLSIEKILKTGSQINDEDERILDCQLLSTIRAVENEFRMRHELQIYHRLKTYTRIYYLTNLL